MYALKILQRLESFRTFIDEHLEWGLFVVARTNAMNFKGGKKYTQCYVVH